MKLLYLRLSQKLKHFFNECLLQPPGLLPTQTAVKTDTACEQTVSRRAYVHSAFHQYSIIVQAEPGNRGSEPEPETSKQRLEPMVLSSASAEIYKYIKDVIGSHELPQVWHQKF